MSCKASLLHADGEYFLTSYSDSINVSSRQELVNAINAHVRVPPAVAEQSAPMVEVMESTSAHVAVDDVSVMEALPEQGASPLTLRRLEGLQLLEPPPSSSTSVFVQEIETLLFKVTAASDSAALLEALQVHIHLSYITMVPYYCFLSY